MLLPQYFIVRTFARRSTVASFYLSMEVSMVLRLDLPYCPPLSSLTILGSPCFVRFHQRWANLVISARIICLFSQLEHSLPFPDRASIASVAASLLEASAQLRVLLRFVDKDNRRSNKRARFPLLLEKCTQPGQV